MELPRGFGLEVLVFGVGNLGDKQIRYLSIYNEYR